MTARSAKDVAEKWREVVREKRWDMIRVGTASWPPRSDQQTELTAWLSGSWDDDWLRIDMRIDTFMDICMNVRMDICMGLCMSVCIWTVHRHAHQVSRVGRRASFSRSRAILTSSSSAMQHGRPQTRPKPPRSLPLEANARRPMPPLRPRARRLRRSPRRRHRTRLRPRLRRCSQSNGDCPIASPATGVRVTSQSFDARFANVGLIDS